MWEAINGSASSADDLSLLAQSRHTLQETTTNLQSEAGKVGISAPRKHCKEESTEQISVGGCNVDNVARFTYLYSNGVTFNGKVNCQIGKAPSVFHHMRPIWTSLVICSGTNNNNIMVVSVVA